MTHNGGRGGGRTISLSIGTLTEVGVDLKACLIGHWSEDNILFLKEGTELEERWFKLQNVGNSRTRICYIPIAVIKSQMGNLYREELTARWVPAGVGQLTLEIKCMKRK